MRLLAALAMVALAQDGGQGFDAHGFSLVALDADPRDGLVLERAGALTAGQVFGGAVLEYARAPLVLERAGQREVLLDHVSAANLSAGVAVHQRLRLNVGVPVFLATTGPDGAGGAAVGDVRLGGLAAIVGMGAPGFGLAVAPWVTVPTGDEARFLGAPGLGGGAVLVVSQELRRWGLNANVGAAGAPAIVARNLHNADHLVAGLGGHLLVGERTGLSAEVRGTVPFVPAGVPGTETPVEAVGSVRHASPSGRGGFLTGGIAGALTPGAGAATFRVFLGGGLGAPVQIVPLDSDGDGLVDREDACPRSPETPNGLEDEDGCPDAWPTLSVRALWEDAPVAGAVGTVGGERFVSAEQGLPVAVMPGPIAVELAYGPCLEASETVEVDGPMALDLALGPRTDARVQVSVRDPSGGPIPTAFASLSADGPGCGTAPIWLAGGEGEARVAPTSWAVQVSAPGFLPFEGAVSPDPGGIARLDVVLEPEVVLTKVRVEQDRIELLEQVHFDTGRATIRAESGPLLDEVVQALASTEGRGRVEVQGHTDSQGSDASNLALSQARAEAVVAWLVERGVAPSRLTAVGYGETQPIAPNGTPSGRQANRRVAFLFVEAP